MMRDTTSDTTSIAILADIHGNIWALDAVLADLARRGVTTIVDLGDSLSGPLDPAATAERLIERGIPSIRGNTDRDLLADPPAAASPTLTFAQEQLAPRQRAWLRALPATAVLREEVLLCHGTPDSDETYLLEAPSIQGTRLLDTPSIERFLSQIVQPVVACGHSHIPRAVYLTGGRLVINPGSVGLPAYSMDEPAPHIMESGSPHAKYALLTKAAGQWSVAHILVPYEWARAAAVARTHGRPDWASAIETGRATAP